MTDEDEAVDFHFDSLLEKQHNSLLMGHGNGMIDRSRIDDRQVKERFEFELER
jgi:hypothetical protein